MASIVLYMAPGTCARVPMIALEEAGQPFDVSVIRFLKGQHKSEEYLALNPKGKVPTLVIDGEALTENVAIALYLSHLFPGLLPVADTALEQARVTADLSYCAATLHPIVTRIRMPQFFAGDEAAYAVREAGYRAMTDHFALINRRLTDQPWWYGQAWSTMDAYLYWIYWRVTGAGFDASPYPHFVDHAARMEARPAVQRAVAREKQAEAMLESEGLAFVPPPVTKPE